MKRRDKPQLHEDTLTQVFSFLSKPDVLKFVIPVCRTWAHTGLSPIVWEDYDWSKKKIPFIVRFSRLYGPYMSSLCFVNCRHMTGAVFEECIQYCPNLTELILTNCNSIERIKTIAGKRDDDNVLLSEDLFRNLRSFSAAYTRIAVPDIRNVLLLCKDTLQVLDLRGLSFKFSTLFVRVLGKNIPPSVLVLPNVHTFKLAEYNKSITATELHDLIHVWLPNVTNLHLGNFALQNSGTIQILSQLEKWKSVRKLQLADLDFHFQPIYPVWNDFDFSWFFKHLPEELTHLCFIDCSRVTIDSAILAEYFSQENTRLQSLVIKVRSSTQYFPAENALVATVMLRAPQSLKEFVLLTKRTNTFAQTPREQQSDLVPQLLNSSRLTHPFKKFQVSQEIVTSDVAHRIQLLTWHIQQ